MGTRENGRMNGHRVSFPANSDESYVPLPQLAAHLERAVLASFAEVLSEECEVDFNENTLDSCSGCLLYTSPSPRDKRQSRMPSSA